MVKTIVQINLARQYALLPCAMVELKMKPGEHSHDFLLRLVVVGWDVEVVHGQCVSSLDPRLDTKSTVVRV